MNRWKSAVSLIVVGLLLGLAGLSLLGAGTSSRGQSPLVTVEIPLGASTAQISTILAEAGVIKSPWLLRAYTKLAGVDGTLKAGLYRLEPGLPLRELVTILVSGSPDLVTVTIVEGQTLAEIAQVLENVGIVNGSEFLRLTYDPVYTLGPDMPEWLYGAKTLEGFLFPDTYRFSKGQKTKDVIRTMVNRFDQVTTELRKHPNVEKLGLVNWVTLASVVEKEGKLSQEFPLIAAVFYNRLEKGMFLQSCATVQYALGVRKPVLTEKDLQVESPFNTYKHGGLPPGPIGSPGLQALEAAANPVKSNYLYFVAKGDGSHVFSVTYKAHLQAKARIEKGL